DSSQYILRQHRVFVALLAFAGISLILLAPETVGILAHKDYSSAALVIPLLALTQVLRAISVFYDALHLFDRRTSFLGVLGVVFVTTMLTLDYLLLPRLGLTAAALAPCAGAAVYFVITGVVWRRRSGVFDNLALIPLALLIVVAAGASVRQMDLPL